MFCMTRLKSERNKQEHMVKKIQNYIFKCEDLLGKGNFGEAYRGLDLTSGKEVAIKVVRMSSIRSQTAQKLLYNQIQILKNVPLHANILKCQDVYTSVNNCYIVTELCQNDLQKQLHKRGNFKEHQIKQLIYGIYKGLLHLAQNHIVHRDIKISNIFINNGQPKIADFGFAVAANSLFKDVNIGSPLYMSPEGLLYRQYGPKTDVWSFGVLIFQLITGKTPLEDCKTDEQLKKEILKPINFPSFISPDIKQVIQKCLTVNQLKRPSFFQLGKLPYFINLFKQIVSLSQIKDVSISDISTVGSLKMQQTFINPYFYNMVLTYDNGLSILHYCRLLHKINVKYLDSKIFFTFLTNLSNSLRSAQFSSVKVFNQQIKKLKEVLKEYHKKFLDQREEPKTIINPREMLSQICRLMNKQTSRDVRQLLQILDTETKVLIYSLEHKNADILTKNSEAKTIIETGRLKL